MREMTIVIGVHGPRVHNVLARPSRTAPACGGGASPRFSACGHAHVPCAVCSRVNALARSVAGRPTSRSSPRRSSQRSRTRTARSRSGSACAPATRSGAWITPSIRGRSQRDGATRGSPAGGPRGSACCPLGRCNPLGRVLCWCPCLARLTPDDSACALIKRHLCALGNLLRAADRAPLFVRRYNMKRRHWRRTKIGL